MVYTPGKALKPSIRKKRGRVTCLTVNLKVNGRINTERIHRLVLATFVGPCPEGLEGCHNDGDPTNNAVSNLRWDTHTDNMGDAVKHGTKKPPPVHIGAKHHNTSLTEEAIRKIRAPTYVRGLHASLGREFGVSGQTIRRIRAREVWDHV